MPRQRRIVVIEDDAQIRELVRVMLTDEGYRVVTLGDPTRAVEVVREEAPDLILCDIAMPVLDGYGVLKALQDDSRTARYPVVFLTAHKEFSERVRAFRFGVVDYLSKPFSRLVLVRKVAKVLEELDRRAGVVSGGTTPVPELLDEIRRDARSGVLRVRSGDGVEHSLVIRAGEVVEGAEALPEAASHVAFEELDAGREDIVAHDPERLPGELTPRSFDDLPTIVRNVLLVDDNEQFRRFLAEVLQAQGFAVHQASSGAEGLRLALERRPWLIITDVRMPDGDGFEFCRKVRRHSLVRQTPLLFLSGWDDYRQRYRGLELGADDFLSKTTPVRELLMRIQLILARFANLGLRGRSTGMHGQIQMVGAPSLLQMCHLNQLTGTLTAHDGEQELSLQFKDGEVVQGLLGERRDAEAVWAFLGWDRGEFTFEPGTVVEGPPLGEGFEQLLLEGCRRLDEARER